MDSELNSFYGLDEASDFFLQTAFREINNALFMERANKIFSVNIMKIDVPENVTIPELPSSTVEMLSYDGDILPDETISKLSACWEKSQLEAPQRHDIRFQKKHEIKSIEIVGHILNLHAFVETTLNRHLYLLKVAGKISGEVCQSLDRTEFIPKLLYLFKYEESNKEIKIQHFRTLNQLRNSAVHFKKDSRAKINPTVNQLLQIWNEVGVLLTLITMDPEEKVISKYTKHFKDAFL